MLSQHSYLNTSFWNQVKKKKIERERALEKKKERMKALESSKKKKQRESTRSEEHTSELQSLV